MTLYVVQHTSGEFLGLMEDHLEGHGIRFNYFRPFTADGGLPATVEFAKGLILLGGGPWGTIGGRAVPSLTEELTLARDCFVLGKPVIGIGLGAQILAIATGGASEPSELVFEVGEARRVEDEALNGFLPERFPLVTYMRDRPRLPEDSRILALDGAGRPARRSLRGSRLTRFGIPSRRPCDPLASRITSRADSLAMPGMGSRIAAEVRRRASVRPAKPWSRRWNTWEMLTRRYTVNGSK